MKKVVENHSTTFLFFNTKDIVEGLTSIALSTTLYTYPPLLYKHKNNFSTLSTITTKVIHN